jgi:hypothetical protein
MATLFILGDNVTGAGFITLRDIKLVELQEYRIIAMQIKRIGCFITLDFRAKN